MSSVDASLTPRGDQIVSESGIAAGVRRIEAVTGPGLYDLLSGRERIVRALTASLKVQPEQLEARVAGIYEEQRKLSSEVERLKVRMCVPGRRRLRSRAIPSPRWLSREPRHCCQEL